MTSVIRCCVLRTVAVDLPWRHAIRKWVLPASTSGFISNRCITSSNHYYKKRKDAESNKQFDTEKKLKNKIKILRVADVWRNMTVKELADALERDIEHVQEVMLYVKEADNLEPSTVLNDMKIIREIALKCGQKTKIVTAPATYTVVETKEKDVFPRPPAPKENLKLRPPVVTVMGHVDHGKTTLLDTLRGASVAAGEAGGITQHIGAFTVRLDNDDVVTFLDTPGHAAFSAMRARGANCTDIIVLVVAADDGVMEQTKEVIQLANDTKVPIIVAINKIDKPEANIERTKKDLLQMGIALEGHGGDVQFVGISALHGTNLQELAETISTQATLMDLRSEYTGLAEGIVIESKTDPRRGKLSTAIVTRGTLRKGAILVSGTAWAKVRGLFDHNGQLMESATPGTPVEILGWRELPFSGEGILEVESEKKANSVVHYRQTKNQMERALSDLDEIRKKEEKHNAEYQAQRELRRKMGVVRIRLATRPKESAPDDGIPRVNIILKGDVHGSVEAILDVFDTYTGSDVCRLNVVHYGVGDVNETDLELAKTFNGIIYAFSTKSPAVIPKGVIIREFNIIYRLIDDLKNEINAKLPQTEVEEVLGEANVLQIFKINEGRKQVTVIGCRCVKGVLKKAERFRLKRLDETICDGALASMRHLKNEVDSIKKDVECGLKLENQEVVPQPGDVLICYTTKMEDQKTDWDPGF
ncbi:Translation initiation factor IF-2, mitochondrial [Pseudolycoriella hygida]|uniref:Translation initiation factor IF-2, mitochondrial n=1 Tax=Pseudolycoriella hygida TaxID=35572 RepID=A0A9Q0RY59_9DIPT|nr:Translation initiation factor IF-2, mitochondrial [Pseudolycoriella hygida]